MRYIQSVLLSVLAILNIANADPLHTLSVNRAGVKQVKSTDNVKFIHDHSIHHSKIANKYKSLYKTFKTDEELNSNNSNKYNKLNNLQLQSYTADGYLYGCYGADYWAEFSIGQPSQYFSMIIDTGSSSVGVSGAPIDGVGVNGAGGSPVVHSYDPAASNTSKIVTGRFSPALYGSADYVAQIVQDYVELQTPSGPTQSAYINFLDILSAVNFFDTVDCITGQNAQPSYYSQGIVGFGPQSSTFRDLVGTAEQVLGAPQTLSYNTDVWFLNYSKTNNLPSIFSLELCDLTGNLYLNGIPDTYSNSIQYTDSNVGNAPYWLLNLQSIGVGNTSNVATASEVGSQYILADSGTSIWTLDTTGYNNIVNTLLQNQNVSKYFSSLFNSALGSCVNNPYSSIEEANANLPGLTVTFYEQGSNTNTFTIELDAITSWLVPQYSSSSDTGPFTYQLCLGISQNSAATSGLSIMGHTYLTQLITVFDYDNNRVGFAKQNDCPILEGSTTLPPQPSSITQVNNQAIEAAPNQGGLTSVLTP